jgi:hypothetical protein
MPQQRTDVSYCSSCFQAKPGTLHVDFDAAWDGPVLQDAVGEPITHTIDELVICESCLEEAAKLIGMDRTPDAARVKELEDQVASSTRRAFLAEKQLQEIQAMMQPLGAGPPEPPKRGPGRPRKNPVPA